MESAVAANTCGGLLYQPALPAHRAPSTEQRHAVAVRLLDRFATRQPTTGWGQQKQRPAKFELQFVGTGIHCL
ncbi:MAG: hypothetical protein CBB71_16965 [Rhodopirellula sp. TMED11]|nr:MAG: hypothetical protein CBB71_16965 [Rhodopirellula sp. TMED11]